MTPTYSRYFQGISVISVCPDPGRLCLTTPPGSHGTILEHLLTCILPGISCLFSEMDTNGEHLAQTGSSTQQGTYLGSQGFLFLLHHKFEDRGLFLAATIFPAFGRNHIWNRRESGSRIKIHRSRDEKSEVTKEGSWEGKKGKRRGGQTEKGSGRERTWGIWGRWRRWWAWWYIFISCDCIHMFLQPSWWRKPINYSLV